ncbi:ubiquitin-like [Momordica charantia]|uniref:Ubiquitin-like n=1 Tax=Momordica charantia TaxID=3673 RepID=A0A6J1DNT8_MOMCH|nr:ubiquitin-like [Momordica charantia]
MASSIPSYETSESISIGAVIKAVQALPDMDEDFILDACDFLQNPQNGEIFMALAPKLRKRWLLRNLPRPGQMKINFQTVCGKRFGLEVLASDTVEVVKAKIEGKEGYPPEKQRLFYGGVQLEGATTLAECRVTPGSELKIILPKCGGH